MPYQVEAPELLLSPLPPRIRTRIWLSLAQIARTAPLPKPSQTFRLGDGYSISYRVDAGSRTVTLVGVEQLAEPTVPAA